MAGTYVIEVDVRAAGSTSAAEAYLQANYVRTGAPCTSAGLSPSPASPQGLGVAVTVTGSATGCSSPQYRFWLNTPGSGWSIVQDYSSTASWSWTSASVAGTYVIEVDVRAAGSTSAAEAYAQANYVRSSP